MVKSVRKSLRKIKKNKRSKTVKGGKAIASGAYGCVFNPALRCMNSSVRQPDSVSKLLLKTAAETEYKNYKLYQNTGIILRWMEFHYARLQNWNHLI